jgi:hypothetical protein
MDRTTAAATTAMAAQSSHRRRPRLTTRERSKAQEAYQRTGVSLGPGKTLWGGDAVADVEVQDVFDGAVDEVRAPWRGWWGRLSRTADGTAAAGTAAALAPA